MTMGKRILKLRKSKGYTQEYIASALGISRQAVFKWEKNQTRPDMGNLIALAELLDTSVAYLIHGKEPDHSQKKASEKYFQASLFLLILTFACWLTGIFSGVYTDMVQISIREGLRLGLPFLMYGRSPLAIILVVLSAVCFLLFILLMFLGHQTNKD